MKLCIFFTLSILVQQSYAACQVSDTVQGTSTVVFTLTPTPMEALQLAGMIGGRGPNSSPVAIVQLLQGLGNAAQAVINTVFSMMKVFPFAKVPSCRYYWISNQLICDNVNKAIIAPLCGVFNIISNVTSPISLPLIPQTDSMPLDCEVNTPRPWGISAVNAPQCWAAGFNGAGVVVANIDTGVRSTHTELKDNLRPFYNWFNPYNTSNLTPTDDFGHGSHTMGTMVGKNIGVAPGAQWIACKGCSPTSCGSEQLLACAQFLACPDNQKMNCTSRPDIINNSWGGAAGNSFYTQALLVWKQLGIFSFFATGNSGPQCSSMNSPASFNGQKYNFFAVGSTACNEHIASYSSVGPSTESENAGALAVDIVGPGSNVYSAWGDNDTAYKVYSGTSMSCPTAAGVGAVLLSKNKGLTYDMMAAALKNSAYRNPNITNSAMYCGSSGAGTQGYPNNVYGYGRVDCGGAIQLV